jgi:peptide/nickel transport system substrate-binding protein
MSKIQRVLAALALAGLAGHVGPSIAQDKPKYGGTLSVGPITITLSPLTWDPADWRAKTAEDAGLFYDRLLVADLAGSRGQGTRHPFKSDSYVPSDALRGALAESWRWLENPLRIEFKLRKGVMFPDKPGVMAARELTAQDVVHTHNRLMNSPKKLVDFWDNVQSVEAPDRHTVVYTLKHFQEDWAYRYGYGFFSSIHPKEVVDAGIADWKKANGSGPFKLTDVVSGNAQTYEKNAVYWGREKIGDEEFKLPFVDRVIVRTIKDEAARYVALRTGKLDLLQAISWSAVEELKRNAPALQWSRWLTHNGRYMAMRVDTKPFSDVRVRRAMNMAINKQEIAASFYGGNAEVFAYPQHPDYVGYFEPLNAMPEAVRELYVYSPERAKKLLAEAGYPKGFAFKAQVCACSPEAMDLAPLVAAYLQRVGVTMQIEPLEFGAYASVARNGTNAPGFFSQNSHGNPTQTLRKNFVKDQYTNNSRYDDPEFARKLEALYLERDEAVRQRLAKELTAEILEKSPYLWLPVPYVYAAWWPWVKNYRGEIYAGSAWSGPIYSRIWIDQEMKKRMGF